MAHTVPDRRDAWRLLTTWNETESLIRHALAVESAMRHFARRFGEDEEKWGVIGLVHDLDWEKFPERHCRKTEELLRDAGWPEDFIRAVLSHGWGFCTDVAPESLLEKTLYAVDELTGLVTATALVRPSKSILDMTAKSVKKKWKEKGFSAGVNREVIEKGAAMLGLELEELITGTILGMREKAAELGLAGTAAPGADPG